MIYFYKKNNFLKCSLYFFVFFLFYSVFYQHFQIIMKNKGFSTSLIGILIGIFQVAGMIGILLNSIVFKRFKILRILLFSLAILFIISLSLFCLKLPMLLIVFLSVFLGFTFWCLEPISDVAVNRIVENYDTNYGKIRSFGSTGFILGSLFPDVISNILNFNIRNSNLLMYILILVLLFLYIAVIPLLGGIDYSIDTKKKSFALSKNCIKLLLLIFLNFFSWQGALSFLSIYMQEELKIQNIGIYWSCMVFFEALFFMFSKRIVSFLGYKNLFLLSSFFCFVRLFLLAFLKSPVPFVISQILHSFTFGALHYITMAFISIDAKQNPAWAISLYAIFPNRIATFISSVFAGFSIENFGFGPTFFILSLFPIASLVLFFIFSKNIFTAIDSKLFKQNT